MMNPLTKLAIEKDMFGVSKNPYMGYGTGLFGKLTRPDLYENLQSLGEQVLSNQKERWPITEKILYEGDDFSSLGLEDLGESIKSFVPVMKDAFVNRDYASGDILANLMDARIHGGESNLHNLEAAGHAALPVAGGLGAAGILKLIRKARGR